VRATFVAVVFSLQKARNEWFEKGFPQNISHSNSTTGINSKHNL
jgi:hypothetical protein